MRIYIAGFYLTHGASTPPAKVSSESKPAWVLESYHYLTDDKLAIIRDRGETIFLDSGAFTMFTQGVSVDLKKYAQYVQDHADLIHVASSLDVIGRGKEQESYNNFKLLESYGAEVQPVHHARDSDQWLIKYLEEGYDYIFLGGMVPESTPYLKHWLDRMWKQYLMDKDGKPYVKVHGFGLTVLELMRRYPWYSVDSTSWVMTSRYGNVYLDLEDGRVIKVCMSDQSPKQKDFDMHYNTCAPMVQGMIRRRVEDLGFKIPDLITNYGWRDRFNIEFFKRIQEREVDTSWRKQGGVFDA